MLEMLPEWLQPLAMVLFIDVVLAGDNAIVVGMAAAGLPADQRRKAIFWGIIAATVMRIAFASITVQLLQIVGIVLAGYLMARMDDPPRPPDAETGRRAAAAESAAPPRAARHPRDRCALDGRGPRFA